MKIITNTYYQANDGTAFDTQDDCEEYERLIAADELDDLFSESKSMYGSFGSFVSSNYDKIKEIMEGKTEDEHAVSTEVNWSKVPEGVVILVRDTEEMNWVERNFIYRKPCGLFVCYLKTEYSTLQAVPWKYAKLKT